MGFTITADLDSAVREAIEAYPRKALAPRRARRGYIPARRDDPCPRWRGRQRINLPAYRLIVTKRLTGQLELFKDPIKHHAILSDFDESWSTERLLDHHNARGTAEKVSGGTQERLRARQAPLQRPLRQRGVLSDRDAGLQSCADLQTARLARRLANFLHQEPALPPALPGGHRRCSRQPSRHEALDGFPILRGLRARALGRHEPRHRPGLGITSPRANSSCESWGQLRPDCHCRRS